MTATVAPALAPLPATGALSPPVGPPSLAEGTVLGNARVARDYLCLRLAAPSIARHVQPGQFVMLTIARRDEPEPVLPRPMAVYGWDRPAGTIDIVYKVVGAGTRRLAGWRPDERMTLVGPLGRGFVLPPGARRVLLIGRGIGTCSLTALAGEAARQGVLVHALASARDRETLIGGDAYRQAPVTDVLEVVDSDGTSAPEALEGRLAPLVEQGLDEIYTCGSNRLLTLALGLAGRAAAGVQVSLEARMACGLGYCHGCAAGRPGLPAETPLVCADGPVFRVAPGTRS